MLDAYIIDAIRNDEQRRRQEAEEGRRIWLDLPPPPPPRRPEESGEDTDRGPIIIPLNPDSGDLDPSDRREDNAARGR